MKNTKAFQFGYNRSNDKPTKEPLVTDFLDSFYGFRKKKDKSDDNNKSRTNPSSKKS